MGFNSAFKGLMDGPVSHQSRDMTLTFALLLRNAKQ